MPDASEQKSDKTPLVELLGPLLGSDLAIEVDAEFSARCQTGSDVSAASARVFERFRAALSSPQDGPVVLIALAALQLREGYLQSVIRDAAVDLIQSGEALNAYRSFDSGQRKALRDVLEEFEILLTQATARE